MPGYPRDWNRRRKAVFKRDGYRCVNCGGRKNLNCHHVVKKSRGGSHKIDNLITLCKTCHDATHDKGVTATARKVSYKRKFAEDFLKGLTFGLYRRRYRS